MANGNRFKLNDRVSRREDVFDPKSKLKYGRVVKVYEKTSMFGHYPELYAVLWDGEFTPEFGFLPHGIDPSNGH